MSQTSSIFRPSYSHWDHEPRNKTKPGSFAPGCRPKSRCRDVRFRHSSEQAASGRKPEGRSRTRILEEGCSASGDLEKRKPSPVTHMPTETSRRKDEELSRWAIAVSMLAVFVCGGTERRANASDKINRAQIWRLIVDKKKQYSLKYNRLMNL